MVESRQLSALDADALARLNGSAPKSEEDILRWLAGEYGLEYTGLDNVEPDRDILARFPARILLREEMLPFRQVDGHVEVALSRLFAAPGLDSLKSFTDLKLRPVLAPSTALQREIKKHLGVGADTLNLLEQEEGFQVVADDRQDDGDLDKAAEDASIIRFVNQILGDALSMRTSDIHVEPFEHELRIRYRIDGLLQEVSVPGQIKRFQPAIVSRIKILSNLNIAEKRVPQDGRIKIRVKGKEVDIRVSVIPMLHGEAVVMRLLRQGGGNVPGLAGLNMADARIETLRASPRYAARHRARHGADGFAGKRLRSTARWDEINDSPSARSSPSKTRSNTSSRALTRSRSPRRPE